MLARLLVRDAQVGERRCATIIASTLGGIFRWSAGPGHRALFEKRATPLRSTLHSNAVATAMEGNRSLRPSLRAMMRSIEV
jgi:hypothetical protein